MKLVVAYTERDAVEPIREELLELGFLSLSVLDASGSVPEPTVTGTYRGVAVERHLRPKARLECIVGDEHASTVTDTIGKHGGDRYFVFVVSIEDAYPTDTVKLDAEAVA
jgi:nitrogen regulatory protein PII